MTFKYEAVREHLRKSLQSNEQLIHTLEDNEIKKPKDWLGVMQKF